MPPKGRKREVPSSAEEPVKKVAKVNLLSLPTLSVRVGSVLSCGQNEVGQLGLGEDVSEKAAPGLLSGAANAVSISAGGMHSLYLTKDGKVFSFGCNDEGALGRDTSEEGSEFEPKEIKLPAKCIKVSAGDSHSACLLNDGRVFAFGNFRDSHGGMGLTTQGPQKLPIEIVPKTLFADIASGTDHLVLLSKDGKVYTLGCAEQGQLGRVSTKAATGESRRGKSELLTPMKLPPILAPTFVDAIWTSPYCTFIRDAKTGKIFAFGLNNYSQLAVEAKRKNKELVFTPVLTNFTDVKNIQGGQHHTLALTNDSKCYAIGRKDYGRLGIGKVDDDVTNLTLIDALKNNTVTDISCGEACSFAVTKNGQVYAWGMGSNNQLGVGSEDDAYKPVLLTGKQVKDKSVLAVSGGGQHTLFIVESNQMTNGS